MFRKASLLIPALVFLSFSPAECEVKLDGTLGTPGNVQGPNYSIEAAMGKQMGASLFHSFEKFDINTGENATFKGPADIERIISRVTGGNPSRIDGAIRSEIQGADFYFINPFGMIFGPNSSLDITGSFFATSADYVKLGQNGRFDARNPENTVLKADEPEAFGFLGQKPGDIIVEANQRGLEVIEDKKLMLAGGNIEINGGYLCTHSDTLSVISVASDGEININSNEVNNFSKLGSIEIDHLGLLRTTNGGSIFCQAEALKIDNGSSIITEAQNGTKKGGDIEIKANDNITISGKSPCGQLSSSIETNAINSYGSDSGNINISTKSLLVEGGAIKSTVYNSGSTGEININTINLNIFSGGQISTEVFLGPGDAKDINISSLESVTLTGYYDDISMLYSKISSEVSCYDGLSNSGSIVIKTPFLKLENLAGIASTCQDTGRPGNVHLDINNLTGYDFDLQCWYSNDHENTGNIYINAIDSINIGSVSALCNLLLTAKSLNLSSYIQVLGSCNIYTESPLTIANADSISAIKDVTVNVPELLISTCGSISSRIGDIDIITNSLTLTEGGHITTELDRNNKNDGLTSGNINITARDHIYISDDVEFSYDLAQGSCWMYRFPCSGIFSISDYCGFAHAGNINITTPNLIIDNHAGIGSTTSSNGYSGNININSTKININNEGYIKSLDEKGSIAISASDEILLDNKSSILSQWAGISIDTKNLKPHDSFISGKDVSLNASESIILNSRLEFDYVDIHTPYLYLDNGEIDAVSKASIFVDSLFMTGTSSIKAGSSGVFIKASNNITMSDKSIISCANNRHYDYDGVVGDISIFASELFLNDNSKLSTERDFAYNYTGGNIYVDVNQLNINDASHILSNLVAGNSWWYDSNEASGNAGDISIKAHQFLKMNSSEKENIEINHRPASIESYVRYSELCNAGNISILSPLVMIDGGHISSLSYDAGNSGDILIDTDIMELDNKGLITTTINMGKGMGGNITINANKRMSLTNDSRIESENQFHSGDEPPQEGDNQVIASLTTGGSIAIFTPELSMTNYSEIDTSSYHGNGGNILLDVGNLFMLYSGIDSIGFLQGQSGYPYYLGDSGDITIKAINDIFLFDSGITTDNTTIGNSGNIVISGAQINIDGLTGEEFEDHSRRCSIINSSKSYLSGKAGNISINASMSLNISNAIISSETEKSTFAYNLETQKNGTITIAAPEINLSQHGVISTQSFYAGDAGDIGIDTQTLNIVDGGEITASIDSGEGSAGDIIIKALNSVNISGKYSGKYSENMSNISSKSVNYYFANGGNIEIYSPLIQISDGGFISCSSQLGGPAGSITIEGDRFLNFSGSVDTTADSSGGGNIFFNINDLFFLDNNASVSTAVSGGAGSGGNITISDPALSVLRSSSIKSSAIGGFGGNIDITTDYFIKDDASILNASSEIGLNGNININSPEIDLNSGLIKLSEEYNDPASFIKDPCIGRMEGKYSSLTSGAGIARRRNPFSYFESSCEAQ